MAWHRHPNPRAGGKLQPVPADMEPPAAPLHPWEWPSQPWTCVHAGYADPIMGKMLLIIVDAYLKWMEVFVTSSASSQATIECMRRVFAAFGLPKNLVTDNGLEFTGAEFQDFLKRNGIQHLRSAPYHPATNGLTKRAIQTLKAIFGNKDLSYFV